MTWLDPGWSDKADLVGKRVRVTENFAVRTGKWKLNPDGNERPVIEKVMAGAYGTILSVRGEDGLMLVRWDDGKEGAAPSHVVEIAALGD